MFWLIAAQAIYSPGMTRDDYLNQLERQYWAERGYTPQGQRIETVGQPLGPVAPYPSHPINNFNCTYSNGAQTCRNLSGQGFRCQNVNGQISCAPFGY